MVPSWALDLLAVLLLITAAVAVGLLAAPLVATSAGAFVAALGCAVLSWRYGRDGDG